MVASIVVEVVIDGAADQFGHGDAFGGGGLVDPAALLSGEVDLSASR